MAEQTFEDQSVRLARPKLFLTLGCLSVALFVSFLDQTSVSTALPSMANDLHAGASISWAGTSFLISNTIFQLLYGRISDIFGRKHVLLASLFLLALGDLLCGFARNGVELFIFRSISGIGGGGVTCLVMIVVSDLLTLKERGKYYGIFGVSTALGNGLGPFVGGLLSQKASWKWTFWIVTPLSAACFVAVVFIVPLKPVTGNMKEKVKKIDWLGTFLSLISVLLFLVAISGAGVSWNWDSGLVISMCVISGVAFIGFLITEAKLTTLPMVPLRLFCHIGRGMLFATCFFTGLAYFVDIYFMPIYLQNIRGWSPISAGAILLPMLASTSISSVVSGQVVSRTDRYKLSLYIGGFLWSLGTGLKLIYKRTTNPGVIVIIGIIQGCGTGFTFQPTLVALLANSNSKDRAVVTGIRNFLRCLGGSIGIIVAGTVVNNSLTRKLAQAGIGISHDQIMAIIQTPGAINNMDLSADQVDTILNVYLQAVRYVFIMVFVSSLLATLVMVFVKDLAISEGQSVQQTEETTLSETDLSDSKSRVGVLSSATESLSSESKDV